MVGLNVLRRRFVFALAIVASIAGAVLLGGTPASADTATGATTATSTTFNTAVSGDCPAPDLSQTFRRWGDYAWYYPLENGDFESFNGWSASSGASIVRGNERFYVNPESANRNSVRLASGSSVTTTFDCVPAALHFRFFFKAPTDDYNSRLTVRVESRDPETGEYCWIYWYWEARNRGSDWILAEAMPMPHQVGSTATQSVKMTITVSNGSAWQLDDLTMDPWRSYR